ALFEHVIGRAAVTGIDETVGLALEARLGGFRCVVDEALGQIDRFGCFAELRAERSAVNELGCGAPSLAHAITIFKTKKPAEIADRFQPGLFSHLFNVAASRPAKSPRDKLQYRR